MPVKDFLPIGDAKITIEKEVKQKPTIAELTTIESPGNPVPASQLISKKSPQKKKKKTEKSPPSKISSAKRDSILIITEKPQAAQKIAFALGTPKKNTERTTSFYELERNGEKIIVASAVGHLFNLTYVKGQKGWPIFKIEWVPSYISKHASFTKNYYDLLKKLSNKAKEIVLATDYDIEGELIGWNVLRFICNKETAKRMKYSTLTKPELERSYDNSLPEPDWGQAYAGETRHILDWLYGINLSRALMSALKKVDTFKILSIGRVQGPALKIIVDREKEISAFKPEPYWQVFALIKEKGTSTEPLAPQEFKHPEDIFDKQLLDKFKDIKEAEAETKNTEESIQPPVPFDLTTLQREAYAHHGISPAQTLSIAQKLYLDSLISYPRTSSQKIPDSIEPKKILKTLSKNFPEVKIAVRSIPIEGKKSDPAHPSIFPTGEFKILEGNELKLFNLIVKRFISAFSPDAKTANRRVKLTALDKEGKKSDITFTASGLKILEKGWTQVYPARLEEKDIPTLNGKVKIDEIKIEEKETQPPKRFTPASLITLLERKNLGTKTTRSLIIETLFDRGYLDGKSIKATPLGMKLIEALEEYSPIILDENLTKSMEEQMDSILKSKDKNLLPKEKEIIKKAENIIIDISKEFKIKETEIGNKLKEGITDLRKEEQENNTLLQCPTCKQGSLRVIYSKKTRRYFIACSAYPNCRQTYSLPPNSLIKKSDKNCPSCQFPKLLAIRKAKRPWEFCFNPNCEIVKKQREEWEAKKAQWQNKSEEKDK
ncbi:MAG: DNA topoisomerase I [Nanoarchaeota archaeon]|nr:DNA topoisomerase I [Nanoarchaeota archaeon]